MPGQTSAGQATPCSQTDDRVLRRVLRVRSIEDGQVVLEGERASACASCAARMGCGAGALNELMGGQQQLRLPAPFDLAPGDDVVVAMEDSAFLRAVLRAYLLPPLALAVTAALALAAGLPDILTALSCAVALAVGFIPLRLAERHACRSPHLWIDNRAKKMTRA